jgi:hypothetical protein
MLVAMRLTLEINVESVDLSRRDFRAACSEIDLNGSLKQEWCLAWVLPGLSAAWLECCLA